MKLFNEDGEEYEGKIFYDENGNQLDMGFFEKTKEDISEAFSTSWLLGILLLIIAPVWGIVYFLFILLFKLFVLIIKCLWWIVKLPFCLILKKRLPKF